MLRRRVRELRKRHGAKAEQMLVFPVTANVYRREWARGMKALGIPAAPPHSARHTGASVDAATGYRTLLQIQRRGRWSSDRSVVRYARTHDLIAAYTGVPGSIVEAGRKLLATRTRDAKPRE